MPMHEKEKEVREVEEAMVNVQKTIDAIAQAKGFNLPTVLGEKGRKNAKRSKGKEMVGSTREEELGKLVDENKFGKDDPRMDVLRNVYAHTNIAHEAAGVGGGKGE